MWYSVHSILAPISVQYRFLFTQLLLVPHLLLLLRLLLAGECIPPRTTALAASTFNLYVSLASVDVNTFQVSCQSEPACSADFSCLPHTPVPPLLFSLSLSLPVAQVDKRLNKSQSQPVENFIRLTWRFISICVFFFTLSSLLCTWEVCRTWNRLRKLRKKNPNNKQCVGWGERAGFEGVVKKFRIQFRKCLGEKFASFWRICNDTKATATFAYCQVTRRPKE